MSTQRGLSRLLMVFVLLLYLILAIWYSVTIPLGEAPDEVPHFTYVRYLARHGRLPTTEEEHEAFQPPLYYVLGALSSFWVEDEPDAPFAVRANAYFDVDDPRAPKNLLLHTAEEGWPYRGWTLAWHLVRLVSIGLGAITVWATGRLGRVFFPTVPAVPLTMAALVAFTPQFLFMSAVANNDNAAVAFSALVLWQMAALLHETERSAILKRCIILGLLLGLGLLSKANLIALVPVVGPAILVSCVRCKRSGAGQRILLGGVGLFLALGLALVISGWYFVRNWTLHGDPMGWSFLLQINAQREGPLTPGILAWLFRGVFRSFWLGWIGIAFDPAVYWIIAVVCAVGLVGFVVCLLRSGRTMAGSTRWSLGLLGLHAAITLGALIQWTATVLGTDQGRLIYPILPTVALVLVAGWSWWFRGWRREWVLGSLAVGMLILAILTPLRYIGPVHAPAPVATEAELAAARPLNVDWDGVRLMGYRLESNEVRPGAKLVLHLYWQSLRLQERDLMALVQLVDESGGFLMYADGSPSAGRDTTDRWRVGEPLASLHLLPVPEYGESGHYSLTISLHPFGEQAWLPASGPGGTLLGDHFVLPETVHIIP